MAARPHRRPAGLIARLSAGGLLALLIAGCAAAPAADVRAGPEADGATVAAPGGPLALSVWPAQGAPRAVLLALHGFGDYAETIWAVSAPSWAAQGIAVYAYDQRGFGRNPSNRQWPGVDALVADAEAVAADIAARHPDLPLFIAGHSMGGAVTVAAAGEGRLPSRARLILLAPALWGGDSLGWVYRAGVWVMARALPDTRFDAGDSPVRIRPSDDAEMLRALARDPLHFANPSSREMQGLVRLMDRAVAAAPSVRQEVLTVMGAHDEVVPEAAVRAGHAALPGPKAFAYVDTGWHMLLRDRQGERVHRLVADWILARAPEAPAAEAAPADAAAERSPAPETLQ